MKKLLALGLLLVVMVFNAQYARAGILITPTRVVFGDKDRFALVTLANLGDKVESYEMEWVYMKMNEGGGSYAVQESSITDFDLSQHIVFSPKRVTLAPGAKQKIRLALRRPAEIPDGDYHVHLKFRALSLDDELKNGNGTGASGEKVRASASVGIQVSYTIPVVLRVGNPVVKADIARIDFSRNKDTGLLDVSVPVTRDAGLYSVLGYLWIYHVNVDGSEDLVGEISNAHIFPEITKRVFNVPLRKDISGGALHVVMRHYDKENDFIYAEQTFPLQ